VIIVGALAAAAAGGVDTAGGDDGSTLLLQKSWAASPIALAAVNIFGGFLVTQRMLGHVQEEGG
jgi:NAD(P) transhydrogenase subunit alpha